MAKEEEEEGGGGEEEEELTHSCVFCLEKLLLLRWRRRPLFMPG